MKKFIILPALALAALVSCKKENPVKPTGITTGDPSVQNPNGFRLRFETLLPSNKLKLTANGETVAIYDADLRSTAQEWERLPKANNGMLKMRLTNDKDQTLTEGTIHISGGVISVSADQGELRAVSDGAQRLYRIQYIY